VIFRHCCHTPSVHVKGSVGSLPPDSPRGLVRCPSSQGLAREGGGVWTAAPVWARGGSGTLETSPERSTHTHSNGRVKEPTVLSPKLNIEHSSLKIKDLLKAYFKVDDKSTFVKRILVMRHPFV
jgi:hypothetical protein